jgi:predicted AAA+ superfamily ATPase
VYLCALLQTKFFFTIKRAALAALQAWKQQPTRKPLIICGARQVGKTWLMKEFARTSYENFAYVNFEEEQIMQSLFVKDFDVQRILLAIQQVNRAVKPVLPLKAYEDFAAFKLFLLDVGLLGAMAMLDAKTLLEGNRIFEEFKGSLTEQYVFQQLAVNSELSIYYWSAERSEGEIDLLVQHRNELISVEVKAAENLRAKSLREFAKKFAPHLAVRTSLSDYREEEWMINVPLYAVEHIAT